MASKRRQINKRSQIKLIASDAQSEVSDVRSRRLRQVFDLLDFAEQVKQRHEVIVLQLAGGIAAWLACLCAAAYATSAMESPQRWLVASLPALFAVMFPIQYWRLRKAAARESLAFAQVVALLAETLPESTFVFEPLDQALLAARMARLDIALEVPARRLRRPMAGFPARQAGTPAAAP